MSRLTFCLLLLLCPSLWATVINDTNQQAISGIQYFKDEHRHFTASNVVHADLSKWLLIEGNHINLGYTQASAWLRFSISNPSANTMQRLLDINYPLLDYVEVYKLNNHKAPQQVLNSGDRLPFTQRNIQHPNFVTNIDIPAYTTQNYLIRLTSNSPIQAQFILWKADAFQQFYRARASGEFFYLGLIFSAAFLNLMIFMFLREPIHFIYAAYACSFALFISSQNAILFEYAFPNLPDVHNWMQLFIGCLTISLTALFNLWFLKIKSSKPSGKILLGFTLIPVFIFISAPLISYTIAIQSMLISIFIILPGSFLIGILNSKNKPERPLYLLAWSWLIFGVALFATVRLGITPLNVFTNNALQIGSSLELLTFAIALAKRIHSEREIRIQAQAILLESSTQAATLQKKNVHDSTHYPTTGLPNRNFFDQWLEKNLEPNSTLVMVKLNRIHEIDKTLGRKVSDQALELFSIRINSAVQSIPDIQVLEANEHFYCATLSSRTHGFVISNGDSETIQLELSQLYKDLNQGINLGSMEIDPCIKIAYVHTPSPNQELHILLRHARVALDKVCDSNIPIMAYSSEIDAYSERRLRLMSDLKYAIKEHHLQLYYQPLVNASDGKIIGAEALLRWPHEEYGIVMPDEFIEMAEQTDIIHALSLWVIRSGLKQLPAWQVNQPDFTLSFNISAHNLQDPFFIKQLKQDIKESALNPGTIILELTETQMMSDTQYALKNLWELAELGLNIAIDDFGTGYSNLSYLKKLPANKLKIDKSFVLNLESDKQNQILVQTAIQMAHNLDMLVVAEGVESERCHILLKELDCDLCQGYHFSRPVPLGAFNKLLETSN